MPQLEFRAIRAVTPRWRLDIMGRGEFSGRKKNDGFAQMWRGLPPCLFFAPQKAQAVDCAAGAGAQKSNPPRNCPRGAGSFVRGGNLLSHTRVQYHRRGRA